MPQLWVRHLVTAARHGCRRPGLVILLVTLAAASLHIGGFSARGVRPRIVRGDAVHYYVYARSLVFDHDLDFENDYVSLYTLDFAVDPPPPGFTFEFGRTSTGRVRNYMAVGTPLTWMPLYLGVSGAVAIWNWSGGQYPLDGYGLLFQLVPTVTGMAAAGLGLWFAFLLCKDVAPAQDALMGTLVAFAGTSYLYYMLVAPSYSHAMSACVSSGLFLYWWKTRDRTDARRYAVLGAIGGLLTLVRWQDGLALFVVVLDVAAQGRNLPAWRTRVAFAGTRLAAAGLTALVVFTPQILAWQYLYGQPFTIPQGGDFMKWSDPAIGSVLFSPFRGLFSWTPIAAASLVGIPWLWRRSPRLAVTCAGFVVASIYVNAAVADWWAGEAFGARRFLSCFPMMALGVTVLISSAGRQRMTARLGAAALVAANLLLLLHYELFMLGYRSLAAYPDTWKTLWVDRFITPVRLVIEVFSR